MLGIARGRRYPLPFMFLPSMFKDLARNRYLLGLLVLREVRIRFARAALGAVWAVLPPLVMLLIFSSLNFERLISDESPYRGTPYVLFAFCGLLFWTHFANSLTQATPSLANAGNLLKKCRIPFEVIPLAKPLAALLDLAIGTVLLGILLAFKGAPVGLSVLALPLVFLLQLLFTVGLVLLLSAANLYFRDVHYLVQVGVVLGMFATSVVYPIDVQGSVARAVLGANPMSSYLDCYREILLLGRWPGPGLLVGVVGALVSFCGGYAVFRRFAPRFAEEV